MSEQDFNTNNGSSWLENLPFVKIFQGFRSAVQFGKIALALGAIVVIFLMGWILDGLTSPFVNVVIIPEENQILRYDSENNRIEGEWKNELEYYASGQAFVSGRDFKAFRMDVINENEKLLNDIVKDELLGYSESDLKLYYANNTLHSEIKSDYKKDKKEALSLLKERYEKQKEIIRINDEEDSDMKQARLRDAYFSLVSAVTGGSEINQSAWIKELYKSDLDQKLGEEKTKITKAIKRARAYHLSEVTKGQGVFSAFVTFKCQRMYRGVKALVLDRDLGMVKKQIYEMLLATCWLTRFHPVFAIVMMLIGLSVWAIAGGAICRMTALQFARDERIGPVQALKFSISKFSSFFTAPLLPIMVIILIGILVFLPSLVLVIPFLGEILGGIFMPIALIAGFIMAVLVVGLMGGFNLMYPAIAVEGSDCFDAISRSLSYIYDRPWRMGFYTAVAGIYGAICYLFVRFFAFLVLIGVRTCCINWPDSSRVADRGILDAIWPRPSLDNFQPDIAWASLGGSECLGAFLVWIWVSLVAAVVLAFAVSFFFSVNTKIYFLLRQRVDATELDEVFIEQDVEDLVAEEARTEEPASPAPAQEAVPPQTPESPESSETPHEEPDESQKDKKE
ncbi:MAG: hypothetical protein JW860_10660 [Sedimentisphaerales bacterium]|nr:hypothetical protein [Sedimentisphaerales bacterium]